MQGTATELRMPHQTLIACAADDRGLIVGKKGGDNEYFIVTPSEITYNKIFGDYPLNRIDLTRCWNILLRLVLNNKIKKENSNLFYFLQHAWRKVYGLENTRPGMTTEFNRRMIFKIGEIYGELYGLPLISDTKEEMINVPGITDQPRGNRPVLPPSEKILQLSSNKSN